MNALEAFRASPAWSPEYDLPLCPARNNPWIYGAYAMKIIAADKRVPDEDFMALRQRFRAHYQACRITSGLINRWPGGRGGMTSHDEIIGAAFIDVEAAREIAIRLLMTDGVYINKPEEVPAGGEETANVYRIAWLRPTLMALAGFRVGLWLQVQYGAVLLWDALRYKDGDEGGRLRMWLTMEDMGRTWLSGFAAIFWKKKMAEKGLSPKRCFEKYLAEISVYREYAPETF